MKIPAVLLLALLAGCRRDPPSRPTRSPGPPPTATTSAAGLDPPAPAASFHEAGRYLPQGTALPGWVQSGSVRYANEQQLFELIDGAAEKYRAYGFRQLARTDYRRAGTELVITAEIYDMGTLLGAFGQYSMLLTDSRDPASMQARAVAHGGGGFLGTSQLVFWKGSHLVQLSLADDTGGRDEAALEGLARESLPALATRIAEALPGETTAPAPPGGFPTEGLVWGGLTYLADNALGIENSGPAWVGHYQTTGGARYRVAMLVRANAQDAQPLVARLQAGSTSAVVGLGDEALVVTNTGTGPLAVARKGAVVVVIGDPAGTNPGPLPREARLERLRAIVAALP